jgi:hypothetical protein
MTATFQRFSGWCAVLAGAASLGFTVSFSVVVQEGERWAQWVSAVTLTAGALVTLPVLVALHARLREPEVQFALVGLLLGVAGVIATAIHGSFDIANLSNPGKPDLSELPNAVDPRGFMTFAVTGLALLVFGWLGTRTDGIPAMVARLALVAGVLLLVLYFGRLTVLNPKTNVIKATALVQGLVVSPAFFLGLGRSLLTEKAAMRGSVP